MKRIAVIISAVALFVGLGLGYWLGSASSTDGLLLKQAKAQEMATDLGRSPLGGHFVYTSDSSGRLFVWEVTQIATGFPPESVKLVKKGEF